MAIYPGLPQPSFRPIARVEDDGYAMSEYHLLNHIGTQVDAPAHQIVGGDTLDEIPLERLVTDAVTIDVSDRNHGPITGAELEPHFAKIREGDWSSCSPTTPATGGPTRTGPVEATRTQTLHER